MCFMHFAGLPTPLQDTKAFFYKNKPWRFVCFTLYLSSGGLKSQRRQGEHETGHLMKSVFPISLEKCLRLTGCTQTHPLIPKPLGVLTVKNIYPGVIQFNIPTLNSPQHLSFRQTPFPIKHEDWEHWTLYSNHITPLLTPPIKLFSPGNTQLMFSKPLTSSPFPAFIPPSFTQCLRAEGVCSILSSLKPPSVNLLRKSECLEEEGRLLLNHVL